MDYRTSDVADGIAAKIKHGDSAFTEVGERFSDSVPWFTEFVVTMDSGQRFNVTVREA